jgi:hypothetical protein
MEMSKINEIANGVFNSINKTKEVEDLSKHRLAICYLCTHNENNKCGLCGCNLSLKSRSIKSKCPDGKW